MNTQGRAILDITQQILSIVEEAQIEHGLCNVFIAHTSASLIVSENADPDVLQDLETFLSRLAPDGAAGYLHTAEGPDDMPAHIRSVLTQTELTIPIRQSRCLLGTWQAVYLWEHRHHPHSRQVTVTLVS